MIDLALGDGMKRILALFVFSLATAGCSVKTLIAVSPTPNCQTQVSSFIARSGSSGSGVTVSDWTNQHAPSLRKAFQEEVYGHLPDAFFVNIESVTTVNQDAFGGRGTLELVRFELSAGFGSKRIDRSVRLVVAKPKTGSGPFPVVIRMDDCPFSQIFNTDLVPNDLVISLRARTQRVAYKCGPQPWNPASQILWRTLGAHHISPPTEDLLDAGYAVVGISSPDFIVDIADIGQRQLAELSEGLYDRTPPGALASWAFLYSRAIDILITDDLIDERRITVYGHSRYGKSALLAAALDPRIAATIAHQSGRLGASLSNRSTGESLDQLAKKYPHWLPAVVKRMDFE